MVQSVRLYFSVLFIVFLQIYQLEGQVVFRQLESTPPPLPFPTCKAENIDCLRRGLRTFLIFMDSGKFSMKSIDPIIINSIAISLPEQQMALLMRNINVTGARWTKLLERRFNLEGGKSGVLFSSDFHVTGEIIMMRADRFQPFTAYITMDIQDVQSNVTYSLSGQRGTDNEDYIFIGPERIVARNTRTPFYFLEPNTDDSSKIGDTLQMKQSILDHFSNEITTAIMHTIVDNFRLFASKVAVKHYYQYY